MKSATFSFFAERKFGLLRVSCRNGSRWFPVLHDCRTTTSAVPGEEFLLSRIGSLKIYVQGFPSRIALLVQNTRATHRVTLDNGDKTAVAFALKVNGSHLNVLRVNLSNQ